MKNLITPENVAFGSIIGELFILLLISLFIVWIVILFAANTKKMNKIGFKQRIKILGLNGLIGAMITFVIYFAVFVAINGKEAYNWGEFPLDNTNTYYQILPQILLYILIITAFVNVSKKLKKELKRR